MIFLKPFEKNYLQTKVKVQANSQKLKNKLKIQFCIDDPESMILLPKRQQILQRSHDLWQTTCFECFFSPHAEKNYWELNLDNHGNWNLYRFQEYRNPQPPQEEDIVQNLELEFLKTKSGFEVECFLDLKELNLENKALDVGLACVIEWSNKEKSFYALAHKSEKPDFHNRETFVCNLE